ncbi:hypothetical protein HMPREF3038_01960 [Akkermansia sp. KLE1797]|nr:hypothetical protein HMPREF3038_01960 [Akkermansia sp. KLE1797]KXU54683.1 hypothetical protein HMPREF3039_01156 [Akkermansia sp. KLE1798]KZA06027.1 hypothetical protein HMPREF1326_00291 [Akkermansia sp. KLE1605]
MSRKSNSKKQKNIRPLYLAPLERKKPGAAARSSPFPAQVHGKACRKRKRKTSGHN